MISINLSLMRHFAEGTGELLVDTQLERGSLTALVGPSGAGKTTVLRLLAGLEKPVNGRICLDNDIWLDTRQGINKAPQQRSVGYIFQDAALFPNLTVRENILFVTPKGEKGLAGQLIEETGLTPFVDKKPAVLSGGQKQRVALVRALVRRPRLLLLDEPFAALDSAAAAQLRQVVLQLHRVWGTTTLLVSHHDGDVQALADRVIRLVQGKVQFDRSTLQPTEKLSIREKITSIYFDDASQQWTIETETMQLRSANAGWSRLEVGSTIDLSSI